MRNFNAPDNYQLSVYHKRGKSFKVAVLSKSETECEIFRLEGDKLSYVQTISCASGISEKVKERQAMMQFDDTVNISFVKSKLI